ncbi:MAG: hypothetical protein Q7S68_03545, partial [Deltaproteobacteria bacterium]|nr:hypothetical protein [Deltaproteobacteria bacterium]
MKITFQGGFETSYAATEALSTVVETAKDSYRAIAGNNFLLQAFKPVVGASLGIAQLVGSVATNIPDYFSNLAESFDHGGEAVLHAALIAPLVDPIVGIASLFSDWRELGNGSQRNKDSMDIANEIVLMAGAVLLVRGVHGRHARHGKKRWKPRTVRYTEE